MSPYDELAAYTLQHGDPSFIHQHVVDATGAQLATPTDRPIRLAFSLIGLYLHLEHAYTGRQVQQAHMRLSRKRKDWPTFDFPADRGSLTVEDVLQSPPGPERDQAIEAWCASVWNAWSTSRDEVIQLLRALDEQPRSSQWPLASQSLRS